MAAKRTNLFLYLALACFAGIITIFIVDGYMGVYDTVYVTAREREQIIEPDRWPQYPPQTSVNEGGKVFFRYEVDNRRFAAYSADIEAAVWSGPIKQRDLISRQIVIAAFDKGELEWVVDTSGLRPSDVPSNRGYEFSVIIKRGETERRVIVYVGPKSALIPAPPSR